MEIIQDDAKKLVQVWLSRKESGDEALQNQLKPMYAQWKQQKYMVAVFHSWRITNGAVRNWRCSGRRSGGRQTWNAKKLAGRIDLSRLFSLLSCNKQNFVLQYHL